MEISDIKAEDIATLSAQGYTENDLAMLAPTEVQALLAPDSTDDEDVTDVVDKHAAAEDEQDAANTGKPAVAATQAAAEEDAPEAEAAPFAPVFKVDVPADAKEQIAALQGEEKTSFKQLMDGTIDADSYQAVRERVDAAVDELKTKALTASIFQQANEQTAEQNAQNNWKKAETSAFASFKAEGLDYKAKPALLAAYNTNLKAIGADPKNESRDEEWFLAEAHRLTKDDLGIVSKPGAKIVTGARPNRVDQIELPPTLRNVPVAATGAVNTDEFAHLRNLSGLEAERAHAKLTNEQRDRWMAE